MGMVGGAVTVVGILAAYFNSKKQADLVRILETELAARKEEITRIERSREEYKLLLHEEKQDTNKLTLRNIELEARTDLSSIVEILQKITDILDAVYVVTVLKKPVSNIKKRMISRPKNKQDETKS